MNVFNRIKEVLEEKTGKPVTMDTNLKDLGLDSLDFLNFILDLEKELNVKIDDNQLLKLKTIKDVVEEINKLI